jgi:RNA polymerase sigma factor (sigma-70 family)
MLIGTGLSGRAQDWGSEVRDESSDEEPRPSTAALLARSRAGDERARNVLAERYLSILRRLARGRVPRGARDLIDSDDLVQNTIHRALTHLDDFTPAREGSFLAWMRTILLNQIRDEARRVARRLDREPLSERWPDPAKSPLEEAAEREALERYEAGLRQLPEDQRGVVMLRLELHLTFPEIARTLGDRSPDAARMLFRRGLDRLARLVKP